MFALVTTGAGRELIVSGAVMLFKRAGYAALMHTQKFLALHRSNVRSAFATAAVSACRPCLMGLGFEKIHFSVSRTATGLG